MPPSPTVRIYLQVTWSEPITSQLGSYVCEVDAVDKDGRGIGSKTSVEIASATSSVTDKVYGLTAPFFCIGNRLFYLQTNTIREVK